MKAAMENSRKSKAVNIMKNIICLFIPFLLTYFCFNVLHIIIGILSVHILTAAYIFLCIHFKFCNTWVLPISYCLHFIYFFVDNYLVFSAMTGFYSFPLFVISLIIAIIVKINRLSRRIMMVAGIIVLTTLFCVYLVMCTVTIIASTSTEYLDDYRDYYFMTVFKPNTMPAPFGSARQIIYFKPGQKKAMLEEIKEDVDDFLKTLIEERGDVFSKYEISDDLTYVNIYTVSDIVGGHDLSDMSFVGGERIRSLVLLYHRIKKDESVDYGRIIRYIEPDN